MYKGTTGPHNDTRPIRVLIILAESSPKPSDSRRSRDAAKSSAPAYRSPLLSPSEPSLLIPLLGHGPRLDLLATERCSGHHCRSNGCAMPRRNSGPPETSCEAGCMGRGLIPHDASRAAPMRKKNADRRHLSIAVVASSAVMEASAGICRVTQPRPACFLAATSGLSRPAAGRHASGQLGVAGDKGPRPGRHPRGSRPSALRAEGRPG